MMQLLNHLCQQQAALTAAAAATAAPHLDEGGYQPILSNA
jgi:hypothetical protein